MTYSEEEGYTEAKVTYVTVKTSGGDIKAVQKAAYEGETKDDEVVGKFIKRRKSDNIAFWVGVVISYE